MYSVTVLYTMNVLTASENILRSLPLWIVRVVQVAEWRSDPGSFRRTGLMISQRLFTYMSE